MEKFRVISMFSGVGGMDLGFINAGFDIIWANDIFKEAVDTYKMNIGNHIMHGDITQIKSEEIPDNADVIIGGFPCQGFSIANIKRSMKDQRNYLYKEMLRVITDKKPKFFVAENVKGLLSMEKGKVIEMIINDFKQIGYSVDYKIMNAAEYGVPQMRERVVIIGNRVNVINPYPQIKYYIDSPKEGLIPAPSTKDAIGFLSNVRLSNKPIELPDGRIIHNHVASTNVAEKFWGREYDVNQHFICDYLRHWRDKSDWTTSKIDKHFGYSYTAGHWFRKDNNSGSIPKPEDWLELKRILKFDDKYDKAVLTLVEKDIKFEQSLRITNWERPSDTITATSPEIHVNRMRRLSVRECAILQTFPMDFIFTGSLNKMYTQVGNAVPVKLAELIASGIKEKLQAI